MELKINDKTCDAHDRERVIQDIHELILKLNNGYNFDRTLAQEWVDYLVLLLNGHKTQLANPYSDINNYTVTSFSQATPDLEQVDSLVMLDELPNQVLSMTDRKDSTLSQSLFVMALGGTDSTFYKGLNADDARAFAGEFFAPDLVDIFVRYDAIEFIPRGFAAKKSADVTVTNVESMIIHAYAAGIRNVAVIANAMTYRAFEDYIAAKFQHITDLNILVTAQPLLPRIRVSDDSNNFIISSDNGGYPGGHGHGFKYCLQDSRVRQTITQNDLRYFIFTNGDNSVIFNWGGEHFNRVLNKLEALKQKPDFANIRIGFFLVWEYLRKGGFSFLLQHNKTGQVMPQIFEAELAKKSGADIDQLETSRGGYNTNVAVGLIKDVVSHLDRLPMVLKEKKIEQQLFYSFEASLATAMTTLQNENGSSYFDPGTAINILGPKSAIYQHWNHIALRKRDDLFAFRSSLFKIGELNTGFGPHSMIYTQRDATQKHPTLAGNVGESAVLNTKDFFDIFAKALFDVDEFYGTLCINLLETESSPMGKIRFANKVKMQGDDSCEICFSVPAGELWLVQDKEFAARGKMTITPSDVIVKKWHAANGDYV